MEHYADQSLEYLQKMLNGIFGERNKRLYHPTDLLLHVFEEASAIAEIMRKESHNDLGKAIVKLLAWLLAFCSSKKINLAEAAFSKYRGVCPNCGKNRHCICIGVEKKPRRWVHDPDAEKPTTCTQWLRMFREIYGNVNKIAGRDKTWNHLLEELGEVSRAYRLNQQQFLREELADTFAWFCSLCNHLEVRFFQEALKLYPGKCDVCRKPRCRCPKV